MDEKFCSLNGIFELFIHEFELFWLQISMSGEQFFGSKIC